MAWGNFYEIRSQARPQFEACVEKGDWYHVLNAHIVASSEVPECDLEEAVVTLGGAMELQPHPWNRIFLGDFHAPFDDTDDPNVALLSESLVREISEALAKSDESFFDRISTYQPPNPFTWLHHALREFFTAAASRGSAVVCIWGP